MLHPANETFLTILHHHLPNALFGAVPPAYLQEPRGKWQGLGGILARPKTVEQVSTLVRLCHEHRVGVIPYGGGTGLVSGQIIENGAAPVILSLERMNKIRAVYPDENVIVVEAGAILADIQAAADAVDRLFPLSLASEGSARIGGNLATNAGGVNVLRYGNTRDLCLGLEVVLPNGDIWNGLTRLRKDNTGYDLRNLMIGSEGTLGVITAAALKLSPRPSDVATAMLSVPSPDAALSLLSLARSHVAEGVSTFELIGEMGLRFLSEAIPDLRQPFQTRPEWCVLIELGLGGSANAQASLEAIFTDALEQGVVYDGVIAQSETQRNDLWAVRERIPEANRLIGSISSHDISLPLSIIPEFIATAPAHVQKLGEFRINCFGHLGDGNLHYNVFPPKGESKSAYVDMVEPVQECIHDLVVSLKGSFSAEHGVGRLKVGDLERYGDPVKLSMMRAIKSAFDPNGIMNPGAVLRENMQ